MTSVQKNNALNLEEAIDLFDQLADMEDIAFGYAKDGCYARAHIMCQRMKDAGLSPNKAWAFENDENGRLKVHHADGSETEWWYHVAASIEVSIDGDQSIDMIIDPSLFDGPVTTEEWAAIMNSSAKHVKITPNGEAPDGYEGNYTPFKNEDIDKDQDKHAKSTMKDHIKWQEKGQRTVFPSQGRQQYIQSQQAYKQHFQQDGKTWKTGPVSPQSRNIQHKLRFRIDVVLDIPEDKKIVQQANTSSSPDKLNIFLKTKRHLSERFHKVAQLYSKKPKPGITLLSKRRQQNKIRPFKSSDL